jgi:glycosyltransferase involved in cell wall biosynthesis
MSSKLIGLEVLSVKLTLGITKVRIVILAETYTKNTSYIGSILPKYLARCGVDVHVLALNLFPYHYIKDFELTYPQFNGIEPSVPYKIESFDGYTIHTLPYKKLFGYIYMEGMFKKLKELSPDIVYSLTAIGWLPLYAAVARLFIDYKLFVGSHTTASTFPLAYKILPLWNSERLKCFFTRFLPGRLVSYASEKCYVPTKDCAEIAFRYFGVQKRKIKTLHLGVDMDYFFPVKSYIHSKMRNELRMILGFRDHDIVCIYSGKMSEEKNPKILAEAIDHLRSNGYSYRGLFIGSGVQKKIIIENHKSSVVLDFMPYQLLANYYRASDIAVWPTTESTSMLDATACGLPLIVSDGIVYREHVNGNGLVYKMNNCEDLVSTLLMLKDSEVRKRLGKAGAEKMARDFNWVEKASSRINDFKVSLNKETVALKPKD